MRNLLEKEYKSDLVLNFYGRGCEYCKIFIAILGYSGIGGWATGNSLRCAARGLIKILFLLYNKRELSCN
jgi:hypothetical protein